MDFSQNKTLRQYGFDLRQPIICHPKVSLLELLREFRKGHSHLALVYEKGDLRNKKEDNPLLGQTIN